MTKREQNLLSLLILVAVVTGILLLYKNLYLPRYEQAQQKLSLAEQQISTCQTILETADLYKQEQDWLGQYEPEPSTQQAAQATLQATCERQAKSAGLEIKQTPLSTIQPESAFYHRARMDLLVSGMETNFYRMLTVLDDPTQFRKITYLRLNPLRTDDTKIEAKIIVEQWFLPSAL